MRLQRMEAGYWDFMERPLNRKKESTAFVKFAVGVSCHDWNLCLHLEEVSLENHQIFADETPITHTVEQAKEESPAVEEKKEDQIVAEHKDAATTVKLLQLKQANQRRKKMNLWPKRGESVTKNPKKQLKVESQASSQENLLREDLKARQMKK